MRKYITILVLLICTCALGQDTLVFKRIDTIVATVDFISSKGTLDTLKSGLLNEGGTTSDIFILKQGREVQKISVVNKSKNYSEKIVFQNNKPVFAQFSLPDGAKWTFYLVGENAYFKDIDRFNKGSGSYWYNLINTYLSLFKEQLNK